MPRNNFRRPRRERHARPQALDGIIGAPSGPRKTHDLVEGSVQRRRIAAHRPMAGVGRRLDNFGRAEGFHAVAQPPMQAAAAQAAVAQPSLLHKTIAPGQSLALPNPKVRQQHRRRWLQVRRWGLKASLAMAVLVMVTVGLLFTKGYLKLHHIFKGGSSAAALQADVDPSHLKGEGDGRVNILLLGIGGAGHDGPDLTDTMLVASIDPVNHKTGLLSIPRDMWVKMPNNFFGNYQKINAAYESGKYKSLGKQDASNANQKAVKAGFDSADQVVEQVLGIPIHYNVLVDFQAFKQAVDSVGGISVNVPTQLYDPSVAWENGWNPVIAKAGVQTMHGQQALLYVRSRETSSDFARTERQRAVMIALKQKILSLGTFSNPLKVSQLLSAFGDNVVTDLSINDAMRLYSLAKQISNTNVQSIGLADPPNNFVTTDSMNGLSVVRPTAGFYNYTAIQNFVRNALRDGFIAKENAQVMVLNGTGTPGLATQVATTLKSYGYSVGTVADAPTHTYSKTVLVDLTKGVDKYTKHYLEQRFGVTAVGKLPDSTIQPGSAKFVIILGSNAT